MGVVNFEGDLVHPDGGPIPYAGFVVEEGDDTRPCM